ncbi:interferon-induced GTP-binding protein MxB-like [Puntigrus tetrazona]|uniref:interferon-induced GTP-binding protein MxB-like n=1 Tax=Puntigrus tetrazona TaxID=1606681 RepID=UPI001C894B0F|nr:interferon-induced GTP-binding protein MxB-like [Puntigrus tetrazona]
MKENMVSVGYIKQESVGETVSCFLDYVMPPIFSLPASMIPGNRGTFTQCVVGDNTTKIEAIKQDKESQAESMLRTQFKMELIVYSQDGTYSQSLQHAKDKQEEEEDQFVGIVISTGHDATLREMRLHLESYYMIASKRLADQIPMVIRYLLLQEAASELQRNMLQLLHDREDIDHLLKEDFDMGQKRESLLRRQKRLMKARNLLLTF